MKMLTRSLVAMAMLALVGVAVAGAGHAQPPHDGPGPDVARRGREEHGGGPLGFLERLLPAEVRESARTLLLQHRTDTYALRQRAEAKEHELNALLATDGAKDADVDKLMMEIHAMRLELFKKEVSLRKTFFERTGMPLPGKPRPQRL